MVGRAVCAMGVNGCAGMGTDSRSRMGVYSSSRVRVNRQHVGMATSTGMSPGVRHSVVYEFGRGVQVVIDIRRLMGIVGVRSVRVGVAGVSVGLSPYVSRWLRPAGITRREGFLLPSAARMSDMRN